MFKVKYHDTIEPQEFEVEFETEEAACEWISRQMSIWMDVLCEEYPDADVTWLNRLLDVGNTTEIYIPDTNIDIVCKLIGELNMGIGDIVRVGLGDHYYLAVVTDINQEEEMVRVKDLSQVEDNIQPMWCVRKANIAEMMDELRSIYGFYNR